MPERESRGTVERLLSHAEIWTNSAFDNAMIKTLGRDMRTFIRQHRVILILVLIWTIILSAYAFTRHEKLNSSAYDLAIKSQVIWNTFQGDWFASSIEVEHYLGDHVQLIFLPLAPLFGLWADVKVLLLLQSLLLSSGAISVARIARRQLDDEWLALLFAIAYLLIPLIGFVNRFDFHPLVFSIPLFLFAYDLLETDHPFTASFFIFLALTLREDVGFTVFAFGLYVVFFMKRRALGLTWAAVGLVWSLTAIFLVIPHFRGGVSDTMSRYAWLGNSPPLMLQSIFTKPSIILNHLLVPYRTSLILKLLIPFGFLSLLSPAPLLVGLPALAYNMLSATPSQSSIYFQYLAPVVPFIVIAAIQGASRVQSWSTHGHARWILTAWIGLGLLLAWIWDNPFTKIIEDPYFPVYGLQPVSDIDAFEEAQALLPPEAPVATMMAYAPHLSLRPDLDLFYDRSKLQERDFGFPQTEYLLLNLADLRWGVNARFFYSAIETAVGQFGYEALYADQDVVLLHRSDEPQPLTGAVIGRVVELLDSGGKYAPAAPETINWMGQQWIVADLPQSAADQSAQFENGITLLGYQAPAKREPGQPLCVTLYWQANSAVPEDYTIFLHLAADDGFVQAQRDSPPVFGFYPTSSWHPSEIVADMHCLQIPSGLIPGQYSLLTGIYNPENGERIQPISETSREDKAMLLGQVEIASPTR